MPDHPTHFAPSIEVYSPLQSSWVQKGCLTAEPGRIYTPATCVNCHYIKLKWTSFLSWNCRPATRGPPTQSQLPLTSLFSWSPSSFSYPCSCLLSAKIEGKEEDPKLLLERTNTSTQPTHQQASGKLLVPIGRKTRTALKHKSSPAISVTRPLRSD